MIEYFFIIKNDYPDIWAKLESISTTVLAILTFATLASTIIYSNKQIKIEKNKHKLEIDEKDKRQKQQVIQILKNFFEKKSISILDSVFFIKNEIFSICYLIDVKYIDYLNEIKKQAIKLDVLEKRVNAPSSQKEPHTEEYKNLINQLGELNIWFAKKGDEAEEEIRRL